MGSFQVETEYLGDLEVISLIDGHNSVKARIIPRLGNNLVSWTVSKGEKKFEFIDIPTSIEKLPEQSKQFYGNPLLFPFPNRIPNGRFQFEGKDIRLPVNFRDGTAIHGLVYDKTWIVDTLSSPSNKEACLKSTFTAGPDLLTVFPFPFELEMSYRLREFELELDFLARNTGERPFPFGYGIHPYFSLGRNRNDWSLYFPATEIYELTDCLPSGIKTNVPEQFNFNKEKSLTNIYLDDLFTGLKKDSNGLFTCWINNRKDNLKLSLISDQNFSYCVLYTPKDGAFICIEPYTCMTNAFNLNQNKVETGLSILEPGESFEAKIWFRIEI